jgi:hypothetical protein
MGWAGVREARVGEGWAETAWREREGFSFVFQILFFSFANLKTNFKQVQIHLNSNGDERENKQNNNFVL